MAVVKDTVLVDPFVLIKVILPVEEVELGLNSALFPGKLMALITIPAGSV